MTGPLQGLKRRLADYPVNQWIEAAGKCNFETDDGGECGKPVEVKIAPHTEDPAASWMKIRCADGHEEEDGVGWDVPEQWHDLEQVGKFFPLLTRSNHAYCNLCGKIIVDVPLILWGPHAPDDVKWELNFCFECVEKEKLLDRFKLLGR